ncbi:hypothetical protein [Acetivibrio clariflavus]|uniref:Uncharacterized protein n=1 Tax=Acetivibrio clariflavus (strain DSM 19732 / NBRC 101661 / EBR45) TaxID=720554 RepID=G8LXK2_ACECE|nr:hypothetical protein [Acetivibrio clariflavus]AEV67713.1 hypothetical protein Clocl_1036 [Acetivibrio clariflavus DSM 19732]
MREWTLSGRIVLSSLAYVLSFIMFINTSVFTYEDFKTSLITVNVIAFIFIGMGYVIYKTVLAPIFFACMFFCAPSVMAYSKLGKAIFDINVTNKFDSLVTAVLFLTIISMLLLAGKLKKAEGEYLSMISDGADEEDVKLITINSLKVYLAFLVGIYSAAIIAAVTGFVLLNLEGSFTIAVITATLGMAMFSGCAFYIYKKWLE